MSVVASHICRIAALTLILQYGAVMGLNKELGPKGNEFSDVNTYFYVVLMLAEFANGKLARHKTLLPPYSY